MDDREKLKHLLTHWTEHTTDHANTYREWSEKADKFGNDELSKILKEIVSETVRLEELFKKARGLL
jgi:hypothetical protein